MKISAVTYFVPEGPLLSQLPQNEIPLQSLAIFMAELHNKGFDSSNPGPDHFSVRDNTFAIHDPTDFVFHRSSISLKDRRNTIIKLLKNLNLGKTEGDLFFSHYAQAAGLSVSGTD